MSQRTNNFKGGIQNGQSASSNASIENERIVRDTCHQVAYKYLELDENFGYKQTYCKICDNNPKKNRFKSCRHRGSITPDGGIFEYKGKIILVVESKHQGIGGNAIERIGTSMSYFEKHNKRHEKFLYITYLTGDCFDDQSTTRAILTKLYPSEQNINTDNIINNQKIFSLVDQYKFPYLWYGSPTIESNILPIMFKRIMIHLDSFRKINDQAII